VLPFLALLKTVAGRSVEEATKFETLDSALGAFSGWFLYGGFFEVEFFGLEI
jgi:hypothetical protein